MASLLLASTLQATAQCRLGMSAHPRSERQKCRSKSPCRRRRTRARPWAYGCRNRPPGGPGTAAAPPIRQISSHSIDCGLQRQQSEPYTQPSLLHRQAYTTSAQACTHTFSLTRTTAPWPFTLTHFAARCSTCILISNTPPTGTDAATLTLPPNQADLPLHVTEHLGPPRSSAARSRVGISEGSGGTETPTSPIAASTRPAYCFIRLLNCRLSNPGLGL